MCAHWTSEWNDVVFSDEKVFTSVPTSRMRVKRSRGERYEDRFCTNNNHQTSVSVNVWGFVAHGFGVRVFCAGPNFDAEKYIICLRENFVQTHPALARRIFLQDNAPFHSTKEVKRFFRQNQLKVMKIAPQSSDLNITENVWSLADRKLSHFLLDNYINRPEDLFEKVKEICESLPVSLTNSLFASMPKRVKEVREKRGKATHY